ncbi:MAG TPA: GspH/FimT family pseudopilin [Candidatus Angelobacter sp.]|nr:GspH/FimT family pseudopilin [Candidatus Angelobacter sp.]
MAKGANRSGTPRTGIAGFSIVELVVSLCVMMILSAIAIPTLMRSLRTYQLNDAATRLAAMLKFTRFEAVRRNTQINFLMKANASGTGYFVGTDSNRNGNLDPTDKQELIAGFATIISSGAPTPTAILTALGVSTLTPVSGSPATITFDARGAIRTSYGGGVSSSIYVFYIGSVNDPDPGYRAVILLPSGTTQIWSASSAGPWQKIG